MSSADVRQGDSTGDEPNDYVVVRGAFEYEVSSAPKGFPLASLEPPDPVTFLIAALIYLLENALAKVLPLKIGVVRQRVGGWRPSMPRVVYRETLPRGTDPSKGMEDLLKRVHRGEFDLIE